ncbi:COX15/CtaA family protein [Amycolatopsis cynarae]|uniref:COX15/CtaA family protein n=1 Tax=Amycolatopsis cynarae TaxID=2995223 RepID=A0ABY7AWF7_9PSEU|nr:COX15/CtaA family protein [Amycolatopsis sp. HUAS 11-8]WAL63031.1 COX15/CtaA family protein [Amycolatopsis sp. HUAS 11-8]
MFLTPYVERLPYPSRTVQRAIGVAAVVTQAGIGVTGSVVRVTGSGLGCSTWPQCQPGSMVPVDHAQYQTITQWIEFGNRLLTFVLFVAAVVAVLAAWRIVLDHPSRRRLVKLAWTLPGGIVLQAVVGGMTVLAKLEWWTVAIHFLVSTPLVWLAVLLLRAFNEGDEPPRPVVPPLARKLLLPLVVVMWLVLAAGTMVSGAGPHGGDPGTHRFQAPIETLAQIHGGLLVAYLVVLATFGLALMRGPVPAEVWRRYGAVWAVALAQGLLGSVQYALGVPEVLVALHVLGSALVIIATAALWCGSRDRGAPVSATPAPRESGELTPAR